MNDNETSDLRRRFGKDRLLQLMQSEGLRRRGSKVDCPTKCAPEGKGDPSCSVFDGDHVEGAWKCHRCGAGGDVFNLAQALAGNLDFPAALKRVQDWDGAPLPALRGRPPAKLTKPVADLWAELSDDDPEVRTYLRTRGLELALDRGLVRCVVKSSYWWLSKKASLGFRLAAALWDSSGNLHSFQLRSVAPPTDPKAKSKLNLLGVDFPADKLVVGDAAGAKTAARVYLAAGMADTLALQLAGVVAIGSPGDENVASLRHHLGDVAGREVVLCPQNDRLHTPRAKVKCEQLFAALRVELLAEGAIVRVLGTPTAHKDPADWLKAVGLDEFTRAAREDLADDAELHQDEEDGELDLDDEESADRYEGATESDGSLALDPDPAASVVKLRLRFQLTDTGNAERLVAQHGDAIRFCHTWGAWLVWDGRRWQRDATAEVGRLAKATVRSMKREFDQEAARRQKNPVLQKRDDYLAGLGEYAHKCESADKRRAMVSLASVEQRVSIEADQLDRDPWLLNVQNGVLDLRTGELRDHRREDLLTRVVPIEFQAGAECPRWLQFLAEIFLGDEDLIEFVQRAVGYSLTGETSEQVFFFCHGSGENGKSVFVNILQLLAGEYSMTADFDTFAAADAAPGAPRPDLVRLRGARVVTAGEPDRRIQLSESRLKLITGEDTLVARTLNEREQEFKPVLKLWLMANHRPNVAESNHGFWRRVKLVPFRHTVPEDKKDKDLKKKLRTELPGILNWAVQGCRGWQRGGLGTPAAVTEATQEYREEMDLVGRFIAEKCFLHGSAKSTVASLYDEFTKWLDENGESARSKKWLSQRLIERQFKRSSDGFARGFCGIGLLSDRHPLQEKLPEVG